MGKKKFKVDEYFTTMDTGYFYLKERGNIMLASAGFLFCVLITIAIGILGIPFYIVGKIVKRKR